MALFPFLKRRDAADIAATPAEQVQRARTRARQRLVGAVVLLGIGIIGFPLLFETEPRPIPVDVTIEIPRKDAVPPLAAPTPGGEARTRDSGRVGNVTPPASPATSPVSEAPAEPSAEAPAASAAPGAPAPPPAAAAPPAPRPPADEGDRARALLEQRPSAPATAPTTAPATAPAAPAATAPPTAPPVPAGARFVVQVGAFADVGAAQRTRERVEKLGLKTYTQVVETGDGPRTRVRVGPFASREEADRAAARLKTAGLTAAVLTL